MADFVLVFGNDSAFPQNIWFLNDW